MPYTFRLSDLPKLDLQVDKGANFEAWKTQWTSYVSLSELGEESAATQVQALILCLLLETLTVVDNLGLSTEQHENVQAIITAIKQYVDDHIKESVEHRNFRKQVQKRGETSMITRWPCMSSSRPIIFAHLHAQRRISETNLLKES